MKRKLSVSIAAWCVTLGLAALVVGCSDSGENDEVDLSEMQSAIDALVAENQELSDVVDSLITRTEVVEVLTASMTATDDDLYFDGVNVYIRSGAEATDADVNGLGNLFVGYNTSNEAQSGSHNLVIGDGHSFTSYGGFIAGHRNTVSAPNATVSGGLGNTASGLSSTVSGGEDNTASGQHSSVSGGEDNTASGLGSTVSGWKNTAFGTFSSVSGGLRNTAYGISSTVSGGYNNTASGGTSSVSGGEDNIASGDTSSVSGGQGNTATGLNSSVSGGQGNTAAGRFSSVSGGKEKTATGDSDWAAGGLYESP